MQEALVAALRCTQTVLREDGFRVRQSAEAAVQIHGRLGRDRLLELRMTPQHDVDHTDAALVPQQAAQHHRDSGRPALVDYLAGAGRNAAQHQGDVLSGPIAGVRPVGRRRERLVLRLVHSARGELVHRLALLHCTLAGTLPAAEAEHARVLERQLLVRIPALTRLQRMVLGESYLSRYVSGCVHLIRKVAFLVLAYAPALHLLVLTGILLLVLLVLLLLVGASAGCRRCRKLAVRLVGHVICVLVQLLIAIDELVVGERVQPGCLVA
mmetsp:Transcript_5232/g.15987  ORF Transcript_5232/g.15987 Transcript_5232/m.15987 type:complete len:268 (-) Transcript_5232:1216-2019(-)